MPACRLHHRQTHLPSPPGCRRCQRTAGPSSCGPGQGGGRNRGQSQGAALGLPEPGCGESPGLNVGSRRGGLFFQKFWSGLLWLNLPLLSRSQPPLESPRGPQHRHPIAPAQLQGRLPVLRQPSTQHPKQKNKKHLKQNAGRPTITRIIPP